MTMSARRFRYPAILLMALLLVAGSAAKNRRTAAASAFDDAAEQQLLQLINQERSQRNLPTLKFDPELRRAARAHAEIMVQHGQLSHQFSGEQDLQQRLAAAGVHSDREGENVGYDQSAGGAHQGFMHSPPHRANILNADYDAIGVAAISRGSDLWVVEDFARLINDYSSSKADDLIAQNISAIRISLKLKPLPRRKVPQLQELACSMSHADKLQPKALLNIPGVRHVLAYTATDPKELPTPARQYIESEDAQAFAVGACFGRSSSLPGGGYWVALVVY